jgi:hypothetical protein
MNLKGLLRKYLVDGYSGSALRPSAHAWERLETKRACRVRKLIDIGGYCDPEEKWSKIHDSMIDAMIRLEKALRPHIKKLKI